MRRKIHLSMPSESRKIAGLKGKLGGHAFERQLARFLGLPSESVLGHGRTKTDLKGHPKHRNINVKNPSGKNTQVFLTPTSRFLEELEPDAPTRAFIGLFFGTSDTEAFESRLKQHRITPSALDPDQELRRKRVLARNIPPGQIESAVQWFNTHHRVLFEVLFKRGYPDWQDEADTLAWAWKKNDCESVRFYPLKDLYQKFRLGIWKMSESGSTLRLEHPKKGDPFLHLQMKGSGDKNSEGYHAMMFHMYSYLLMEDPQHR
jgi:hypothetical protein